MFAVYLHFDDVYLNVLYLDIMVINISFDQQKGQKTDPLVGLGICSIYLASDAYYSRKKRAESYCRPILG